MIGSVTASALGLIVVLCLRRVMLLMWDLKDGKLAKMTPRLIKKMYIVIHWSDPVDYAAVVTTTFMSLANQCFSLRNVFFFFFAYAVPTAAARGQQ